MNGITVVVLVVVCIVLGLVIGNVGFREKLGKALRKLFKIKE